VELGGGGTARIDEVEAPDEEPLDAEGTPDAEGSDGALRSVASDGGAIGAAGRDPSGP
jgi:hypothetical protein